MSLKKWMDQSEIRKFEIEMNQSGRQDGHARNVKNDSGFS